MMAMTLEVMLSKLSGLTHLRPVMEQLSLEPLDLGAAMMTVPLERGLVKV